MLQEITKIYLKHSQNASASGGRPSQDPLCLLCVATLATAIVYTEFQQYLAL